MNNPLGKPQDNLNPTGLILGKLDALRARKNSESLTWNPIPPRSLTPVEPKNPPRPVVSKFLSSGAEAALLGILQKEQPLSLAEIVLLAPEYKKRVIADALQRLRKKNKAINHPVKIEGRFVWQWLKC